MPMGLLFIPEGEQEQEREREQEQEQEREQGQDPEAWVVQTEWRRAGRPQYTLRRLEGRMFNSIRYFATVRRAMTMPFSSSIRTTS
jgi:hypothetical protein